MRRVVLDSNILLLDANNILTLGKDSIIVLAETVIKEVDNKKSGFGELAYQSRQMGRILACCDILGNTNENGIIITKMLHRNTGVEIEVVELSEYLNIDNYDSGANDQKIIQVATRLQSIYEDVVFITNDTFARIRALTTGIKTTDLKLINDVDFEFVKDIDIDDGELFRTLHDSDIYLADKTYVPENYSYKFTDVATGQVKLATVSNGFIKVLGKDNEKAIRQQECPPINSEQLIASKALLDPKIELVIIEGQAGSGKNIIALSNAIRLLETNKDKYNSIVYIRTPINDEAQGEDIGYLSGNEEKYAMYLGPMEDTLDFIVRKNLQQKSGEKCSEFEIRVSERMQKFKENCNIQSMITTGLRGRTFHNAVVILDEWQNASQATSQKVLTRIGNNCKVIVTGSQAQIDNKYITKYNNGLAVLMGEARDKSIDSEIVMFAIELKKVVRSKMAEFAEKLFMEKAK